MDYRKLGETFYVRADKGDEIIDCILEVCKAEKIKSAVYSGIGGCSRAEIQTFIPETGAFDTREVSGMLELVSLNGSVTTGDNGELFHHTHAAFSYVFSGEHRMAAGHIKSIIVRYTAEIELRPVINGVIKRKTDAETGTGFWNFGEN